MTIWLLGLLLGLGVGQPGESCAGCHPRQAGEHALSRHAVAFDNSLFQHEYAPAPKTWCLRCHAPAVPAIVRASPPPLLADQGVGCVSCHVRQGRMVSSSRSPGSIHETVVDADFGGAQTCESCHQFDFPRLDDVTGALIGYTEEPMQNTVAEYRRSGLKASCADCHMSSGHVFAGSHQLATLRRALTVDLCRLGRQIRVAVRARGVGHNVPTGGVHRHIAVRIWRSSSPARVQTEILGRWFEERPGGGKRLSRDTTMGSGEIREMTFESRALGGGDGEPFNLRIEYVYQAPGADPARAPQPPLRFDERRMALQTLPACRH